MSNSGHLRGHILRSLKGQQKSRFINEINTGGRDGIFPDNSSHLTTTIGENRPSISTQFVQVTVFDQFSIFLAKMGQFFFGNVLKSVLFVRIHRFSLCMMDYQ